MLQVKWGNRLEVLADTMFEHLSGTGAAGDPASVFARRDCIVVPNRLVQYWLLHRFLFRGADAAVPHILADVDFPLLNVFVNDWLAQMGKPVDTGRDPVEHPFSVVSMQWRIHQALQSGRLPRATFASVFAYIQSGVSSDFSASENRSFKMAGRLAKMYDEYMVYRPEMLRNWEAGHYGSLDAKMHWQPELWRCITEGALRGQTYLADFFRMNRALPQSGVQKTYRALHVFGVSMMPVVYVRFFELLSDLMPVRFYVFNPSRRQWFDEQSARDSLLEGRLDPDALFSAGNPFLSGQGRGARDFLVDLLDRTEGQAEADDGFETPTGITVLDRLQRDILDNDWSEAPEGSRPPEENTSVHGETDKSMQLHVCHSPLREMEVLRDHLLRWFTEDPTLQPRDIQVQVSDMATYAPYIDAVFATSSRSASDAIPYVVADRVAAGESQIAEAFRRLLELADSRFTAPEVLDLMQCESVCEAFDIGPDALEAVSEWIEKAGIRWGHDAQHRRQLLCVDFDPPEATTWRRGLDRLLLGYVYGRTEELAEGNRTAQEIPLPCDQVEGDSAVTLGRFVRFYDRLCLVSAWSRGRHAPGEWADVLDDWIGWFFVNSDENYRDIGVLRKAVATLRKSAAAADADVPVGLDVVRQFLAAQIKSAAGGEALIQNAVVFSALRPGSSMPRRVVCLSGMGDGQFPRSENRPHYDLFRVERRMGDRSQRVEDRMAFLESVLSARDRLYISYTGFATNDGREIPPSVLVDELREHVTTLCGKSDAVLLCRHRLQAHHPAYFEGGAQSLLFSYSHENLLAAKMVAGGVEAGARSSCTDIDADAFVALDGEGNTIEIERLIKFFIHPAEFFYRNILKVRLDVDLDTPLEESEEFDPSGMAGYRVNQTMVAALLQTPAGSPGLVRRQLEEDGQLPLLYAGEHWFNQRWNAVESLLGDEVDGLGTLAAAVKLQMAAEGVPAEVLLAEGRVRVAGVCRTFNMPFSLASVALDFRWGRPRIVDKMAAWIRHLFACAAGISETRFYYSRKPGSPDKAAQARFEALAPVAAQAYLLPLVQHYMEGNQRVLPFTPETAYAYVSALRRSKKTTEQEASDDAFQRAAKSWSIGDYSDDKNVYYQKAFGAEGPFEPEAVFAATALRVIGPLYDAEKDGPEKGDREEPSL